MNDFLLKSRSLAMCSPRRSTLTPTIWVLRGAGGAHAASCTGDVTASRVSDHHDVRVPTRQTAHVVGDLGAERLDAGDTERRVERGVEVTRLLEQEQEEVEELRAHRALDDLGAELFAGARLLLISGWPTPRESRASCTTMHASPARAACDATAAP